MSKQENRETVAIRVFFYTLIKMKKHIKKKLLKEGLSQKRIDILMRKMTWKTQGKFYRTQWRIVADYIINNYKKAYQCGKNDAATKCKRKKGE